MGLAALWVRAAKADDGRNKHRPFRWDSTGFQETSVMNKRHTGTQIVAKFRQADVLVGQGKTTGKTKGALSSRKWHGKGESHPGRGQKMLASVGLMRYNLQSGILSFSWGFRRINGVLWLLESV